MAQQVQASAQQPFPQDAFYYGGMYQLGNPVAVYRMGYRQSITLGIICLLLAGLFGAVVFSDSSRNPIIILLLVALLCVAGAVYYLIVNPVLHGSWRIYEYTGGFVFLKGTVATACRWDQVAFVWQRIVRNYTNGVYTGTTYKYTVQRSDGVQMVMTEMFRNIGQLGQHLQREVSARLAPQALAALKAGRTLPFDRFSFSQQGLLTPKGLIPWNQMQQVTALRGQIMIQRRGERRASAYGGVDKIPNLYVFLFVAEDLVKGQR